MTRIDLSCDRELGGGKRKIHIKLILCNLFFLNRKVNLIKLLLRLEDADPTY